MQENNFISIYAYAKAHGLKAQDVYRQIREKKFHDDDISVRVVERMAIKATAKQKV